MTEEEFLERVRAICRDERAERVMLFGSRARMTHRAHSDFDLAIWGLESTRAIAEKIERIPTLFSADVVNMETCRNAPLLMEIERHGILVPLYNRRGFRPYCNHLFADRAETEPDTAASVPA